MSVFKRLLLLLLLIPISFYSQGKLKKQSALTRKYAPVVLKKDVAVLKDIVLAMHPVNGVYKNKSYYSAFFDTLGTSITDSLTEKEFRIKLKLAIDELHCGHTEVIYSDEYYRESRREKYNYSPYYFIPVQNKVYMLATLNKKKDTLIKRGTEIVSINGIATDSMLRHCRRFISTDGYNVTGKNHYVKLGFNAYYLALFGRPDTFTVEVKKGDSIQKIKYAAFKAKSIPSVPLGQKDDSLYKFFKKSKMKYRFLDEEKKTMVLKIDQFSRKRFKSSYRRIFRKLKKENTENLVIDLRNNGGGSLENSYRLLSYIIDSSMTQTLRTGIKSYPYKQYTKGNVFFKLMRFGFKLIARKRTVNDTDYYAYTIRPRKKNHFDKKVFVLINGGSFSASCLVSAYLKYNNRAIFIGEETAGAIEGCNAGITPYYKLPNTKIKVRMPVFRIMHDVCPRVTGHGIMPDYETRYTINDILNRRDLDIEKVKELVKQASH